MKELLRKIFRPILSMFEEQEGEYAYKPSHRLILKVVGTLFFVLALASLVGTLASGQLGALLPVIVFFGVGLVCMVVGFLGQWIKCGRNRPPIDRGWSTNLV